jgi:predicted MFS family arabinose efflux permease
MLSLAGFSMCLVALLLLGLIGEPSSDAVAVLVGLLLGSFVFFHSSGPGAQGMTMATLSYPTSLRGTGAGFGQAVLRVGSTISLLLFPVLSDRMGTQVFWVVAIAPAAAIVTLLLIRWDPTKVDVDAEDYPTALQGSPTHAQHEERGRS